MTEKRAKEIITKMGFNYVEFGKMIGKHGGYVNNWSRYGVPGTMAVALRALDKLSDYLPREQLINLIKGKTYAS